MSNRFAYAKPRHVEDPEGCFFCHVMYLAGIDRVGEHWDLRNRVDDYLGRFDFRGKRAVDIGAASGFLTFERPELTGTVRGVPGHSPSQMQPARLTARGRPMYGGNGIASLSPGDGTFRVGSHIL